MDGMATGKRSKPEDHCHWGAIHFHSMEVCRTKGGVPSALGTKNTTHDTSSWHLDRPSWGLISGLNAGNYRWSVWEMWPNLLKGMLVRSWMVGFSVYVSPWGQHHQKAPAWRKTKKNSLSASETCVVPLVFPEQRRNPCGRHAMP